MASAGWSDVEQKTSHANLNTKLELEKKQNMLLPFSGYFLAVHYQSGKRTKENHVKFTNSRLLEFSLTQTISDLLPWVLEFQRSTVITKGYAFIQSGSHKNWS